MPKCQSQDCGKEIYGTVITAVKKKWHPECFKCTECKQKLRGKTFFKDAKENPLCEKDYEEHAAPKCKECKKPVIGEIVSALDKEWHPECFVCAFHKCKKQLKKEPFKAKDNQPYCKEHYEKLFQEKPKDCKGCTKKIDDSKWIEAMGFSWHSKCFVCQGCKTAFDSGSSFVKQDDKAYHKKCIESL
ncbi:PDZ and LIM domain protein 7-like [Ptychodera flava]|uniref:PDZ and LIM domain protein 7-like n=1 Tax=Ptychodera flava TaxID=63121 RepID=UPI003969E6C7